MLGLFLLGLIVKRAGNAAAATGVTLGIIIIFWLSSSWIPKKLQPMIHSNLTIVVGTLTIFLAGLFVSTFMISRKKPLHSP